MQYPQPRGEDESLVVVSRPEEPDEDKGVDSEEI
jgi:hypothetical protein